MQKYAGFDKDYDLTDLGSYRQISRVFKLVDANKLIKIGAGIYAKASFNEMLNRPIIKGDVQ
jgi:prefoldin subunit 5